MATIELKFGPATHDEDLSLSGAAGYGDYLFVAPDEGASIVRLQRHDPLSYQDATSYPVARVVHVPGPAEDEIDLEGMDVDGDLLWVIGSHSAVRTRVKKSTPPGDVAGLLAQITHPPARRLLARIPVVVGPNGAEPVASRIEPNGETVSAASLPADGTGPLTKLLSQDEHLSPFIGLPGKDNGLDIEGLAVIGPRVLLGLRGPVLRGWAVIVEIAPRPRAADPTKLELGAVTDPDGPTYAKHFFDLQGLGIRDLARHGDDLLILAGPTMILDGPSRILRLRGGAQDPLPAAVADDDLHQLGPDLPTGSGHDHPEAITVVGNGHDQQLLVLYDSPAKKRLTANGVHADLLPLA